MKITSLQHKAVLNLAIQAGQEALRIRNEGNLGVTYKSKEAHDALTIADPIASEIIVNGLKGLFPKDTVISEEDKEHSGNGHYTSAWVVDPIDGTQRYSEGKPEFGVLIGRVENGEPVYGVAYYPAYNVIYYTDWQKHCSFRQRVLVDADTGEVHWGTRVPLSTETARSTPFVMQRHTDVRDFFPGNYVATDFIKGSPSGLVALTAGECDVLAGPHTMHDWDLVAVDAIARKAGAVYVDVESHKPLKYGEKRSPERAFYQERFVAGNQQTLVKLGLLDPQQKVSAFRKG